jgi:hypothetical protein
MGMKRISALLSGAVLGVAILAACGGGGGSGSSLPAGPAAPGATVAPAGAQSFSASDAVAIPTAAPGAATVPVPLPSDPSGASGNVSLSANGNIPPDATIAATYSSSGDASLPALSRGRSVASVRGVRDSSPGSTTVIAYLRLQFSADVTLPQAPAFTFVVPGTLPTNGVSYWLAFIDPLRAAASWQKGFEGPAIVTPTQTTSGKPATQLAFASNGQPLSFVANQRYYFAVYAVDPNAASPTPVPSSVPSNPPPESKPAPVLATPTNVQFAALSSSPVPVTFSQTGFTGNFTLHGDCTGIINTSGASPTWTLTPIGIGRCVIVGLGDRGASAVVHIGVVTPLETPRPYVSPTPHPSISPTTEPTTYPTTYPSHSPEPTLAPTTHPTTYPTTYPSHSPEPTNAPTTSPTSNPTTAPTHPPEPTPTPKPSVTPSPTPAPGGTPHN